MGLKTMVIAAVFGVHESQLFKTLKCNKSRSTSSFITRIEESKDRGDDDDNRRIGSRPPGVNGVIGGQGDQDEG